MAQWIALTGLCMAAFGIVRLADQLWPTAPAHWSCHIGTILVGLIIFAVSR